MEKKGQLGNLQGIIVVLILIGILLGAGFFILDEFLNQVSVDDAVTVSNETGFVNSTGYTLLGTSAPGFNTPVITEVRNESNIIAVGNYTVSPEGIITNATEILGFMTPDAEYNISYTYLRGGEAYIAINVTSQAMLTIPRLLGLIVLIAVVGVILAIIFNVIPGTRTQGA